MGSANLIKKRRRGSVRTAREHEVDRDTIRVARREDDAELRFFVPQPHFLKPRDSKTVNATCHGTQEHISLCTLKSTILLNYI